jgi:hypothetical protein
MVTFCGFFPKLRHFAGFLYVYIIYIAGRISSAAMAGDIIFFSLADPVGPITVIFHRVFLYIICQKEQQSCDGRVGGRGWDIIFFRVPNSLEGCNGWGEEYYTWKPCCSSEKIYATGSPSSGLKRSILLEICGVFSVYFAGRISEAAMGGAGDRFPDTPMKYKTHTKKFLGGINNYNRQNRFRDAIWHIIEITTTFYRSFTYILLFLHKKDKRRVVAGYFCS